MEQKQFYTTNELAKLLDVLPQHIRYLIKNGKIQADKLNRDYIITIQEAKKILKERGIK